jgi:3D (Asp-Asp-Asp) domain-containing protein
MLRTIRVTLFIILILSVIAACLWIAEGKPKGPYDYYPVREEIEIPEVKHIEIVEEVRIIKDDEWELWTCTAYTSIDPGCNNISAIEMDIYKFDRYFDFCAIDPDYYQYGDIFQIIVDGETKEILAVDCGSKIKGKKRMDIYFGNDLQSAYEFGVRELEVKKVN